MDCDCSADCMASPRQDARHCPEANNEVRAREVARHRQNRQEIEDVMPQTENAAALALADKIAAVYERVKLFPENQPDGGFMDLLLLRNLAREAEQLLRLAASPAEPDQGEDYLGDKP
jgi:hypothetical protein